MCVGKIRSYFERHPEEKKDILPCIGGTFGIAAIVGMLALNAFGCYAIYDSVYKDCMHDARRNITQNGEWDCHGNAKGAMALGLIGMLAGDFIVGVPAIVLTGAACVGIGVCCLKSRRVRQLLGVPLQDDQVPLIVRTDSGA